MKEKELELSIIKYENQEEAEINIIGTKKNIVNGLGSLLQEIMQRNIISKEDMLILVKLASLSHDKLAKANEKLEHLSNVENILKEISEF